MKITLPLLLSLLLLLCGCQVTAQEKGINNVETQNYRVRLFFGLSLPEGGGVSLKQWEAFQRDVLAKTFDGFNVVDSTGFYKGQPERSKIVTIIVKETEMAKVKTVAQRYATRFNQDSVMMVKIKVDEWAFIEKLQ